MSNALLMAETDQIIRAVPHPSSDGSPPGTAAFLGSTARRMRDLLVRYSGDHHRALAAYNLVAHRLGIAECLELLALAASAERQLERAAVLLGAAEVQRAAIAAVLPDTVGHGRDRTVLAARAALRTGAHASAWAEGCTMPLEQAIAYALATSGPLPGPAPADEGPPVGSPAFLLTAREREVAGLIAHGLTNRQIAAELVISERTADAHVGNILAKLGLRSRAQAAVWAVEQGLHRAPAAEPGRSPWKPGARPRP